MHHHNLFKEKSATAPLYDRHRAAKVAAGIRGGEVEVSDLVDHSFEWVSNLGAPSALVAGAVIGTLYENMRSGDLELLEGDTKTVKLCKQATHTLLLSAFVLEVVCIFVTTVMGTVLLSRPLDLMDNATPITSDATPLSFLKGNFEFEYLTARITFLQGLFNWLAAVALNHVIPNSRISIHQQRMNRFIGSTLFSTVVLMLSFYNGHMTFYSNYCHMLMQWMRVFWTRFIWRWPVRPLIIVFVPALSLSILRGYEAFGGEAVTGDKEKTAGTPFISTSEAAPQ